MPITYEDIAAANKLAAEGLTVDHLIDKLQALRTVHAYLTDAGERHNLYLYKALRAVEDEGKSVRERIAACYAAEGLDSVDKRLAETTT